MPAAYLAQPQPISLLAMMEPGPSSQFGIDLEWDDFQAHVESFLNAMDTYTSRARGEIVGLATQYQTNIRDTTAAKDETERRIQQERGREADMLSTLETERVALAELNASVGHLQASLSKVKEQSRAVEDELNGVRREVSTARNEKLRQGTKLGEMRKRDDLEMGTLEDVLGWRVDGVGQDKLLMRFKLLDPADPDREFSLVIDISKQDYQVTACDPVLPNLSELLAQLNADRDLSSFIKRLRKSFKALVPTPQPPPSKFDTLSGPGLRTPAAKGRVVSGSNPQMSDADLDRLKLQ